MPSIDIRAFGDKELEKQLGLIVDQAQKTIVSSALRKESTRAKKRIVSNIAALGLIKRGVLIAGYQAAKIRSTRVSRSLIRVGVENPTRAALGISADDPYYFPYAVEFGHARAEPKPFIRPAIDEHRPASFRAIGKDIGSGILRAAKRGKTK